MKKVLIIDDEQENRELVSEVLRSHFEPLTAATAKDGIAIAVSENPAAILLDINLPDMDGFQACKRLKEQPATRKIPILMLTGRIELDSRVRGLDTGADDYISKPFHVKELIARINARLRKYETVARGDGDRVVANVRIRPRSFQAWVGEREVRLTKIEFDLLRYFAERPNEVIDRARLLGDLWPDAVVTTRTVDTHVANLRRKLNTDQFPLDTIYGAGYILRLPQGPTSAGGASGSGSSSSGGDSGDPDRHRAALAF